MRNTKKNRIYLGVLLVVLFIIIIAFIVVYNTATDDLEGAINEKIENGIVDLPEITPGNMKNEIIATVVNVDKSYIKVKTINGDEYYLNYSNNNNEQFEEGQQILIFYNSEKIIETTPPVIQDIGRIDIK